MERSAGETGGEFPFQHLFAAAVSGGDPVAGRAGRRLFLIE
jgi:hypothetical protein